MAREVPKYVHRAGVHITAKFADQLLRLTNLNEVRIHRRGVDLDFDQQALAIRWVAMEHRGAVVATGDASSDQVPISGSDDVETSEPVAGLECAGSVCTTTEVAARAGVGVRAVVKAISEYRLPATWSGSRWLVADGDAAAYAGTFRSTTSRKGTR